MKLLKNKFFVTVIAIAIALCMVPTVLYATGQRDLLREGLSIVATPFRVAFNWIADGFEGFGKYFSVMDRLIKENEQLKKELEKYKAGAAEGEVLQGENEWLREQLGFISEYSDCTLRDAAIIGKSATSHSVILTLNRGSECGIEKNMPIIAKDGVIGYVKEVGFGSCKVAAVTDLSSAIGVYCPRTGVYGTAEGSERYILNGHFAVSGLASDCDVAVGDIFCTSGYGGIFPKNFPVGRVVSVTRDEFLRTLTVELEPIADIDGATRVFAVIDVKTEIKENGSAG